MSGLWYLVGPRENSRASSCPAPPGAYQPEPRRWAIGCLQADLVDIGSPGPCGPSGRLRSVASLQPVAPSVARPAVCARLRPCRPAGRYCEGWAPCHTSRLRRGCGHPHGLRRQAQEALHLIEGHRGSRDDPGLESGAPAEVVKEAAKVHLGISHSETLDADGVFGYRGRAVGVGHRQAGSRRGGQPPFWVDLLQEGAGRRLEVDLGACAKVPRSEPGSRGRTPRPGGASIRSRPGQDLRARLVEGRFALRAGLAGRMQEWPAGGHTRLRTHPLAHPRGNPASRSWRRFQRATEDPVDHWPAQLRLFLPAETPPLEPLSASSGVHAASQPVAQGLSSATSA